MEVACKTDTGQECVEIRLIDHLDSPMFDPPLLNITDGAWVRFTFDMTYSYRQTLVVQSGDLLSPCNPRDGGWTSEADRDKMYQYLKWTSGSSFFYGQLYRDIDSGDPQKACKAGYIGGANLSLAQLNQYRAVLGLSATTTSPNPSSTALRTVSNNTEDNTVVQVVLPILFVGLLLLFGLIFLIRAFLKRRASRRRQREADTEADAEEASRNDNGRSEPGVVQPQQTVELLMQEDNRLVMRAASVSSLPRYSSPPPPVPPLPLSPPSANPFASPEDDEARDQVPLMMSERLDRRASTASTIVLSPTDTAKSEDTLPEYMSMGSRPPSFVSRMAPSESTGGIIATLWPSR